MRFSTLIVPLLASICILGLPVIRRPRAHVLSLPECYSSLNTIHSVAHHNPERNCSADSGNIKGIASRVPETTGEIPDDTPSLVPRATSATNAKKLANKAARKERKTVAKAEVTAKVAASKAKIQRKTGNEPTKEEARNIQKGVRTKQKNRSQALHNNKAAAKTQYNERTPGSSGRNDPVVTEGGKIKSGKSVRQKAYNAEVAQQQKAAKQARIPAAENAKKIANKTDRKQRKTERKAAVSTAAPGMQAAVRNNQIAAAQQEHAVKQSAGQEYRKTQNLPNKNDRFVAPAGGGRPQDTKSGKDIRTSLYAANVVQERVKASTPARLVPNFGSRFANRPHNVPGTHGTTRPIQGMTRPGREHTISSSTDPVQRQNDHRSSPMRIITEPDETTGGQNFRGVVAHDRSRTGGPGVNDHFQIQPIPRPAVEYYGGISR